MFIGHFGAAYAAKRAATIPSLGWLFAATQFPDLLWPLFVLAGIERFRIEPGNTAVTPIAFDHYPWSHSLLMVIVWGAVLGGVYFLLRRNTRGAAVVGVLVVSHWVLDWLTHRPDLPFAPGGETKVGLGLWNNAVATVAIETLIFLVGVTLYLRCTSARTRSGSVGFWILAAVLLAISAVNLTSPPPPSENAVAITALGIWLFVLFAGWVDHRRVDRAGGQDASRHTPASPVGADLSG